LSFQINTDDFWNYVACTSNYYCVTNSNIFTQSFIVVVSCDIGHSNITDLNGFKFCNWCQLTGSTNKYINVYNFCRLFFWREFMRHSPVWLS
jgi:hypothetical protein